MTNQTPVLLPLKREVTRLDLAKISRLIWILGLYVLTQGPCLAQTTIQSLSLINADTGQAIGPLAHGDTVNLQDLPTTHLAIRANTAPAATGSVRFNLNGSVNFRTENAAPYTLFGDTGGRYAPWRGVPLVGTHTLTVIPFSGASGSGVAGTPLTATFTIANLSTGNTAPTLKPIPPQKAPQGDSASDQQGSGSGSASPHILSFTLVNAKTGQDLGVLSNGSSFNLRELPTAHLAIRANTPPAVKRVRFDLDGTVNFRTEGVAPFTLFGDVGGRYTPWHSRPLLGTHTLSATPYSGALGAGRALTITFTLIDTPIGKSTQRNYPPKLAPISPRQVTFGDSISFKATASDGDGPNAALRFSLDAGAPVGASMTANTGAFSWIPSATGQFKVWVRVTDQGGLSDVQLVSIIVTDARSVTDTRTGEDAVASFTLINANTGRDIGLLAHGDTLKLQDLPTTNLAIRANTSSAVKRVRFDLDGTVNFRTESAAPYTLFGDSGGNYARWNGAPLLGSHTLTATPFSTVGVAGAPLKIAFTVVGTEPSRERPVSVERPNVGGGSGGSSILSWQTKAFAPLPRFEAQGIAVEGMLYVFGGFYTNTGGAKTTDQSDAYDPTTNTWVSMSDMPERLTHAGHAVDGQSIYLAGGYVGDHPGGSTDHVWIYDTLSDTWISGPDLPGDRAGGGLARLGRELHYFGGAVRAAGSIKTIDFGDHWVLQLGPTDSPYDDATRWTVAAPMPNPRNHLGAVAVGGKIYAIGGQYGENEISGNQRDVHAYDPRTHRWTAVAKLPRPLGHNMASTIVANGRIVVAGGVTQGAAAIADVVEYDPSSNTWVTLSSLPAPRQSPVAGVVGDKIIVTGGGFGRPHTTTWVGILRNRRPTAAIKPAPLPRLATSMPVPLGEIAGGTLGQRMYIVGEGDRSTLAYDLSNGRWSAPGALANRPFVGHHHAAEVVDGKLILIGGLGGRSEGQVQIYDPRQNRWTLGRPMPFTAGSVASATIGGMIYAAGGITGLITRSLAAVYDPRANIWSMRAPMPKGVNHAASATDGREFYVFGGRDGGNWVSNGFNHVQIYDPATDTWESNTDYRSTIVALPQARGGTGKAVFHPNGEFYVFGGETRNGTGATAAGVYNRVDIYNPATNRWRRGAPMSTARHGIFPLLNAGRIYIAGGGVRAGFSRSNVLEIYNAK